MRLKMMSSLFSVSILIKYSYLEYFKNIINYYLNNNIFTHLITDSMKMRNILLYKEELIIHQLFSV